MSVALILLAADHLSKALVEKFLKPLGSVALLGDFFRLSYVQNTGAAFGSFHEETQTLAWVSLVCLLVLFFLIKYSEARIEMWGYALIFSGALGNFLDRAFRGYVVDFLDFDFWDIHLPGVGVFPGLDLERWYVFNLADSYIFVGTWLILWFALTETRKKKTTPTS